MRRHRFHALGLALASILWHLWLSAYLSSVATGLAGDSASSSDDGFAGRDGDDARDWEGAERRRIEGVRALLGIARVSPHLLHSTQPVLKCFGPAALVLVLGRSRGWRSLWHPHRTEVALSQY